MYERTGDTLFLSIQKGESMKQKRFNRFLAFLLVFVMIFTSNASVLLAKDGDSMQTMQEQNETETQLEAKTELETETQQKTETQAEAEIQQETEIQTTRSDEESSESDFNTEVATGICRDESIPIGEQEELELPDNGSKVQFLPSGISLMSARTMSAETPGKESDVRYCVLVLDTSDETHFNGDMYIAGTSIDYVKKSAVKFIDGIRMAYGENHVAIVEYKGEGSNVVSGFSTDYDKLLEKIDDLSSSESVRSVEAGLDTANQLLDGITDETAIKNVILFTTGLTNAGKYSYEGLYDENTVGSEWYQNPEGIHIYAYANAAIETAEEIKEKATIYSVGLFQSMEDMPEEGLDIVDFMKLFAFDLASSADCYYNVEDPDDLEFVFGEIADNIVKKTVTFTYASGDYHDYHESMYYSDDFFYDDACGEKQLDGFNINLAVASLGLALSAFGSNDGGTDDYSNKYKNVQALLTDLKYENFAHNDWFEKKPQSDSIGVAVASKRNFMVDEEEYTLIAAAVRGGGYESEWAGNFTLGKTGQHFGFSKAKTQVLDFLREYIKEQGITGKIKLWITGYSRAAATSNLVAGALVDGADLGDVTLTKENLYAYCFETPMGALKSQTKDRIKYNNIYNIINKNDPVTKVAMSALDFSRFGGDYFLPEKVTDGKGYDEKREGMEKIYKKLASYYEVGSYNVDDFSMKKISIKYLAPGGNSPIQDDTKNKSTQADYLDTTINKITKERIKTRKNFVEEFQNGIRIIFTAKYGTLFPDEPLSRIADFFDIFSDKLCSFDTLGRLVIAAINPWPGETCEKIINEVIEESLNEAGINNYSPSALKEFAGAVTELVVAFVVSHPNLTVTGICNKDSLGAAHYPELCLAWLKYLQNPSGEYEEYDGNGNYRIIHINCPIDVEVYDSSNHLVAKIVNDVPQEMEGESVVASINEDGEKIIYLPANASYQIKLTATDDGVMNYAVNEYSSTADEVTRILNYRNIELHKNAVFYSEIPAYADAELNNEIEGSSTVYQLKLSDQTVLTADQDLTGEDIESVYHMVTVDVNDPEGGIVIGQGVRGEGNFAKIEAAAKEGYTFDGWYEDDKLVSSDNDYRFCVEKDTVITAKFTKNKDTEETKPETPSEDESMEETKPETPSEDESMEETKPETPSEDESMEASEPETETKADGANGPSDSVETGDSNNMFLWIFGMIASLSILGAAVVFITGKRRK